MVLFEVVSNTTAESPSQAFSSPLHLPTWLGDLINTIISYVFILLIIFGFISNVLNILVYAKMGFSETINISFFAMAISDLVSLSFGLWMATCQLLYFYDYEDLHFLPKEIIPYTGGWPNQMMTSTTAFLTAFVSLERCLCVIFPLKIKTIVTRQRTLVAIFVILALNLLPCLRYLMMNVSFSFDQSNRTLLRIRLVSKRNPDWLNTLVRVYLGMFLFLFPSAVVIICSIFLSCMLKKYSKWRTENSKTGSQNAGRADSANKGRPKELRTIKMVLLTATVFIVCTLPFFAVNLLSSIFPDFTLYRITPYSNLFTVSACICIVMFAINSSANFLIFYSIGTNFRQTFQEMFSCAEKKIR